MAVARECGCVLLCAYCARCDGRCLGQEMGQFENGERGERKMERCRRWIVSEEGGNRPRRTRRTRRGGGEFGRHASNDRTRVAALCCPRLLGWRLDGHANVAQKKRLASGRNQSLFWLKMRRGLFALQVEGERFFAADRCGKPGGFWVRVFCRNLNVAGRIADFCRLGFHTHLYFA
jgi:hypothetical protein